MSYLFLSLSVADLVSTIVGLNLGLVESGLSGRTPGSMGVAAYSVFRLGGAAVAVLLFRGVGVLFKRVEGADLLLRIAFGLVTILLAAVVINNLAKILIVIG